MLILKRIRDIKEPGSRTRAFSKAVPRSSPYASHSLSPVPRSRSDSFNPKQLQGFFGHCTVPVKWIRRSNTFTELMHWNSGFNDDFITRWLMLPDVALQKNVGQQFVLPVRENRNYGDLHVWLIKHVFSVVDIQF